MQLELGFWPRDSVRVVLMDYLAMRSERITQETRDDDYGCRVNWLLDVLGEGTPADAVTFAVLERVARAGRMALADVTIRKRLRFWLSAVDYAVQRGVVVAGPARVPPWLNGTGRRMDDFYTMAQYQAFRMALPPGRFRRFADLAMFTGMHTYDLVRTERRHLEPDYVWEGSDQRGRWIRRNHKNRRCAPAPVPMEPELRELALEWLSERGPADGRIVGPVNNLRRTFTFAADRAELPPIRPNLGLRASHSTLLMARGYSYEYVRLVLGHEGEVRAEQRADGPARATTAKHPTTLSRHYLRPSPDLLRPQQ